MQRIRTIKPEFFNDEDLAELSISTRLLFVGLWTLADREGRLADRPRSIKLAVFPWDEVDVERGLLDLAAGGFIVRYEVGGKRYIEIPNFVRHQRPNHREAPSEIPARACPGTPGHARGEGKGREGKGKEGNAASARRDDAVPTLDRSVVTELLKSAQDSGDQERSKHYRVVLDKLEETLR